MNEFTNVIIYCVYIYIHSVFKEVQENLYSSPLIYLLFFTTTLLGKLNSEASIGT